MATADEILNDALRLPSKERARLAHELLLSLDKPVQEAPADESEWAKVIKRRVHEVVSGKVKLVSVEDARRSVAERLGRVSGAR
ncbi:addiction module protein [Pyxidicoccus fallax]|uniref:Addiction module protein n=1 Tax=Pyxidicoccus fallax TaxID=394095 RepID=A0A848LQ59_9BACT|nr:addiction module protein [Pyxidicoccus fallax]NMO20035.1 addiction module protein [Pyxidicoccus fallax]NPC80665.1 addiction module protein [Pyxidicoccus fallax]